MNAKRLSLGGLILISTFACGDEVPVWDEIPPITIESGGSALIDLDDFVDDPDGSDELLLMTIYNGSASTIGATLDATTHVVTFIGAPGYEGSVIFEITATDTDGNVGSTLLEVNADDGTIEPGDVPIRSCDTEFSYDAGPGVSSVAVAGQFNGWSTTATQLADDDGDGIWTGSSVIPEGNHQYKLVLNGDQWILDPANPLQAWEGDFINSAIRVGDCTLPEARIESASVALGRLRGTVQYVLGNGQGTIPPAPITLKVAGETISYDFDSDTGLATFDTPAAAAGKYTITAQAKGLSGFVSDADIHPLWVESDPFDWRDSILYFAMTDRFYNGDTSNDDPIDGVEQIANYQGGDWDGIRLKIAEGYFDDLGVDAIWISPIRDNPDWSEYGTDGRLYTGYHGYWPVSSELEGRFGGPEAMKAMVKEAHKHGIRIMLDLVANHVHDAHPFWQDNPGWFNEYDWCGDGDSWNLNPIGCWFVDYLPDLNYRNPDALFTNLDVSLALVTEYDLDAVRLDALKHMEKQFEINYIAGIESELEESGVEVYTVGETFVGPWDDSGYNQGLIKEHIGEGLLDGQFDFPLYWEIIRTFARDEQGMNDLAAMMAEAEGYYGAQAIMSNFLGNHDIPRFISHASGDIGDMYGNGAQDQGWNDPPGQPTSATPYERLRLGFTFLMTIKGVPLIYYGDEIGLAGAGDPDNRRAMPWGGLLGQQEDTRDHLAALTAIRRAHPALSRGSHIPLYADYNGLAYGRSLLSDKLVVALNKGGSDLAMTVDVSALGFDNGEILEDALTGEGHGVTNGQISLVIPPRSGMILSPRE